MLYKDECGKESPANNHIIRPDSLGPYSAARLFFSSSICKRRTVGDGGILVMVTGENEFLPFFKLLTQTFWGG